MAGKKIASGGIPPLADMDRRNALEATESESVPDALRIPHVLLHGTANIPALSQVS